MRFFRGLHTDNNITNQPEGTWRDAKNVLATEKKYSLRGDKGFIAYGNYPNTHTPNGIIEIPNGDQIIFSVTDTSSVIGKLSSTGIYTDIINDSLLNFSINNPITGTFRFNFKKEITILFNDGKRNAPRILNIDDLPFSLNIDKSLVNDSDIDKLLVFSKITSPKVTFDVNDTGGIIKSGAYFFAFQYVDDNEFETNYTEVIGNIYITEDTNGITFDNYDGVKPGISTSKSILLNLTEVDTRYKRIKLIVIRKEEGQLFGSFVKQVSVTSDTLSILYTGSENEQSLSLEEILTPSPYYNKAQTLTVLQDVPYIGNLETEVEEDLQPIANDIIINYTSKTINPLNLTESHKLNNVKGFAHGGVYAFYMQVEYTNGTLSKQYHIPGRTANSGETDTSTDANSQNITAKKFQVEDTSNSNSQGYINSGGLFTPSNRAVSNMGFWENSGETYSSTFPDFAGQKVRHHKFPTVAKCKSQHYFSDNQYGVTKFDVLGIIASNIIIPSGMQSKIKSVRILYAKRDLSKSNIVAQDILLYSASTQDDSNLRWSTGGNWDLDAQQAGSSAWDDMTMENDYIRMHAFDLMLTKPSIAPTYIQLELKLTKSNLNTTYQTEGKAGGKVITSGAGRGKVPTAVIDYTDDINVVTSQISGNKIVKINTFDYYTHHIVNGNLSTRTTEACIFSQIHLPSSISLTADTFYTQSINEDANRPGGSEPILAAGTEETYLFTVCQLISDMYSSYKDQQVVYTNHKLTDTTQTELIEIYGGDVNVSYISFICAAPMHGEHTAIDQGIRVIRAHLAETAHNANLRHIEPTNQYTKYYPKVQPLDFLENEGGENAIFILEPDKGINTIGYNNDYTSINTLVPTTIYDELIETTNKFPFRVIRGSKGNRENALNSWRYFLPTDYYEANTNRGEIINIQGYNDRLLIHHEYGLFITLGKERLLTSTSEVTLGTGDIFTNEPKVVQEDKLGFIGTKNRLSCGVTPYGYVSIDTEKGHIHILSDRLQRISDIGMSIYFRDLLRNITGDNPYQDDGICIGFDQQFNRLLFTFSYNSTVKTLSYSNEINEGNGGWVSFHDYSPRFYFRNRYDLFSINNQGQLYKHNHDNVCIYYDSETIYPWEISLVFNQYPLEKKLYKGLLWDTESTDVNGIYVKETFNTIRAVTTNGRTTGDVTLTPFAGLQNRGSVRLTNKGWRFNKLRVPGNTIATKYKLIDYTLTVILKYNNEKDSEDNQNLLYLNSVNTYISPTVR